MQHPSASSRRLTRVRVFLEFFWSFFGSTYEGSLVKNLDASHVNCQ
jgi:hypothetical protein